MRITRLALQAYGHFTELALDFPTPAGLHVVLGANEAGKSTALAAIGDALFGFPHRSEAAWRHAPRDLRVGLTLRREDGGERSFWRRKGREPTLLDEEGTPVSDAALAGFLGSLTRERFERVFGLNDVGLRAGGKAILDGSGDLGESVLEAETGVAGSREALLRLEREAAALWGDKRGSREVWMSLGRYDAARRDLAARTVRGPEHERDSRELASIDEAAAAARGEMAGLEAERTRLARIRATTPIRQKLAELREARGALGEVKRLPADADAQRQEAVRRQAQAVLDLDRRAAERRAVVETLAGIRADDAVLREAAAIESALRGLSRIEALDAEVARLTASGAAHRAAGREAALALGRPEALKLIVAPDGPARRRARALLVAAPGLREQVRQAEVALAARQQTLGAMPAGEEVSGGDLAALARAVDGVRALGPLEEELAAARRGLGRDEGALAGLVERLGAGGTRAVVELRLPFEADEAAAAAALQEASVAVEDCARSVRDRETDVRRAADEVQVIEALGAPPGREALVAAREAREAAFEAVLAGSGDVALYRVLVREADALADRRAEQAVRLAEIDALRMAAARSELALEGAARAHAAALVRREEAAGGWRALWAEVVPDVASPEGMREWRRAHSAIVAAAAELAAARREVAAREERIALCHARLDEVLAGGERETLARRLERVDAALRLMRAQTEARAAREVEREALRRELVREEALLADAVVALDRWRGAWSTLAAHLRLALPDDLAMASDTLDEWERFEAARAGWETDEGLLETARAETGVYDAALDRLRALVPGAASIGGRGAAVAVVEAALRAAEAARDERRRQEAALAGHDEAIALFRRARDAAGDALAGLFALAGVADEPSLAQAIENDRRRVQLEAEILERERELGGVDDGMPVAALAAEAEAVGMTVAEWPERLAAIAERVSVLGAEASVRAERRAGLAASLRAMGEQTSSDAAVAMQDELAGLREGAGRYVRLRLAHGLLAASIERLRRENQDPLLIEAGRLFSALTGERYDGLEADDEDGRPVMLARRADRSTCPVARLSEGTLDQLYLALRLASLARHGVGAERIPLVADDLLASFDDVRARAALQVLRRFGEGNQTILFTHHGHIAAMAVEAGASLHHLEVV